MLEIKRDYVDGIVILSVANGPLRTTNKSELIKDKVTAEFDNCQKKIIINLLQVMQEHVDSTSIGYIVAAHLSATRVEGRISFIMTKTSRLFGLLKIARLDTILSIYENQKEAEAALKNAI